MACKCKSKINGVRAEEFSDFLFPTALQDKVEKISESARAKIEEEKQQEQQAQQEQQEKEQQEKKKRKTIIIILSAVAVSLIGIGAFVYIKNIKNK